MSPRVSVIVPCYNQAQFLNECLQSVLDQTYQDWECIIVNDGSVDNTEIIAQEWGRKDNRFKYLYKENGGLADARNYGIERAIGAFILPLDSDDKIAEDYLAAAVEHLEKHPDCALVYCQAQLFGDATGIWELAAYSFETLLRFNMIFCTALYKRSSWKMAGGYDKAMKYGWEDWEFWINILQHKNQVYQLPMIGFFYRIRGNSMIRSMRDEHKKYLWDYVCKKHYNLYTAHLGNPLELQDKVDQLHATLRYIVSRPWYRIAKKVRDVLLTKR